MSDDHELPWPRCLGVFDEESCRYFLHDVGKRFVPHYPFSFGMEEVYTSIVDRYGFADCTDAIAILQELLENEHNADGLGDDGDVWRSWRHGWRHRNDDLSNPYIPRVGDRILPAPSSLRIRRLKINNFVGYQQSAAILGNDELEDNTATCLGLQSDDSCAPLDDRKEPHVAEVANLSPLKVQRICAISAVDDLDTFDENIQGTESYIGIGQTADQSHASRSSNPPFSSLRVNDLQLLALRGGRSGNPSLAHEDASLDSLGRLSMVSSVPAALPGQMRRLRAESTPLSDSPGHIGIERTASVLIPGESPGRPTGGEWHSAETSEQNTVKHISVDAHLNMKKLVGATSERPPLKTVSSPNNTTRTANRQARLVDGTIFTLCPKKSTTSDQTHANVKPEPQGIDSKSPVVMKVSLTNEKKPRRISWLRAFRSMFPNVKSKHLHSAHQKHRSVPILPSTSLADSHVMSPASASPGKINMSSPSNNKNSKPHPYIGLDGASDYASTLDSGVNLNKPLPLNPEDVVKSMSSRTSMISSTTSFKLPSLTASTASSNFSGGSSKPEIMGRIQEVSDYTSLGPYELPPITKGEIGNRTQYEPPKSPVPPSSPKSYKNFAIRNPWEDEQTPRTSVVTPRLPPCTQMDGFNQAFKPQGLPLSHSEPQLQYASVPLRHVLEPMPLRLAKTPKVQQNDTTEPRGREEQSIPAPRQDGKKGFETTPKRSRSPVKRLLGLGRGNNSGSPVVNERSATPKTPKTPTSKKTSMKKWGDRLRYGFLAADQEQIMQEELIEQHMYHLDTPPSQKSTFPVSLEPPHQAKAHSEMELIITVTANRFLLKEARAGRLSPDSVSRLKDHWHAMGRPQVIEFHYDQLTQHGLIIANLKTIRLHGDAAKDPLQINSTLHGWKMMAKEMSIRTLCDPDSVIRKHLHDGHRVLELLGAPFVTFLAYDDMQVKTLARISARQKDRMARKAGSAHGRSQSDGSRMLSGISRRNFSDGTQDFQYTAESFQMDKINLAPSPTPTPRMKPRKPTGAENAIMELPLPVPMMRTRPHEFRVTDQYDESRGGRLGKTIREKPEDLLL